MLSYGIINIFNSKHAETPFHFFLHWPASELASNIEWDC